MLPHPIGKYVLCRLEPDPETTESGLFLPQVLGSDQEQKIRGRLQKGVVVGVGDGHVTRKGKRIGPSVNPGDEVFLNRWLGTEVRIAGVAHVYIKEDDVAAVVA